MMAWLLTSRLGHLSLALLCILLAGALCYWRGHSHGWDAATAHYSAVVNSCLAANATQERTIGKLEAANREWARAAKGNAAKVAQAIALSKADETANARALAAAQARIHKIEASHGDAHAWSVTPVPAGVLDALRADRVH